METRALLFYLGTMDWIKREEASHRLDSDCRTHTTYPSSKFTLKLKFIIFRQWRHVHSCFTQEQWIGSKGKRHRAGWIRTAGQMRIVTAARTSYGLRFGRSYTFWKAYQIYFPMDPESPPYLFGVNRNPRFTTESFSATVLRHPNLAQRAVYQVESKTDAS
jgi:hypothetical protein